MSLEREEVLAVVDGLYRFRDLYFEEHPLSQAGQKPIDVEKRMNEALSVVEENQAKLSNKAEYLLLKAKCLNVKAKFDEEAEEAMSKAVKLDPKQVEAWNILGECFWKKGDVDSAKNCFSGALQHSKDKVTLRNLSMVLRQFGSSREEKLQYITESVSKAKEAVNLDIGDGTSWLVLGNAYLSQFFGGTQNEQTLQLSLKAYTQAEKDVITKNNPDLHYNRSMCHLYQSSFKLALISFITASKLDPSWDLPTSKVNMVRDYLQSTASMISNRCGLLGKSKLQKIMSTITDDDLGPYGGGSYTSPSGKTLALESRCLYELEPGLNHGIVISGKVIGGLSTDAAIPYTFFVVDSKENCLAVCLYNVSTTYGVKTGDSIAIPEPYVMSVEIGSGDGLINCGEVKYNFIRVATPMVMVVNGKKLGIDKQAPTLLKVTTFSE